MPDPVQPMDIDSVSSTTGGDKPTAVGIVGGGKRRGRGEAEDLYLVSPMLAPATKIRQGTVGTMSPEVQRMFRHKVNLIFSALALTSTLIHIMIIHTSRNKIEELGNREVIEGQEKLCDGGACSRLLAMLVTLCLVCAPAAVRRAAARGRAAQLRPTAPDCLPERARSWSLPSPQIPPSRPWPLARPGAARRHTHTPSTAPWRRRRLPRVLHVSVRQARPSAHPPPRAAPG